MTDGQAIKLRDQTQIGPVKYDRYEAAEPYGATGLDVQVRYNVNKVTPAYLRQVARELAMALGVIASEIEATKGGPHGTITT